MPQPPEIRRRWRDYRTPQGGRPIRDFLDQLSRDDLISVASAMKDVAETGLRAARHLRGEIYEVRAHGEKHAFRILFAPQGRYSQILLSLEAFAKKTRKTPPDRIELAERRLADWKRRGGGT